MAPEASTIPNALSPTCAEGDTIEPLYFCTPRCEEGYTPDEAILNCFPDDSADPPTAQLYPPTFYCDAQPCVQPEGIVNAMDVPCRQGGPLPLFPLHRSICVPQCIEGYRPSIANLTCLAGKLYPPAFECTPMPCILSAYNFTVDCMEFGGFFYHGESCTPRCPAGYASTIDALECVLGQLVPNSFECRGLPCEAPAVGNAHPEGACVEGSPVGHEENCTARCAEGYEPWCDDEPGPRDGCQLRCNARGFHAGFRCVGKPCRAPDTSDIAHADPLQACEEGSVVDHGGRCTPRCAAGYGPSVEALACSLTVLEPASYTCLGLPCDAPAGIVDADERPCAEGPSIAHGGVCTARCAIGFVPSVPGLACTATRLSPASFSCIGADCTSPRDVRNASSPACLEADAVGNISHGSVCTPQCDPGYTPLPASLTCRGAVLRPSTMMCISDSSLSVASQVTDDFVHIGISRHLTLTQLDAGSSLMCYRDVSTPQGAARCVLAVAVAGGGLWLGPSVSLAGDVEGVSLASLGSGRAVACLADAARGGSLFCRQATREADFSLGLGAEAQGAAGVVWHFALASLVSVADAAAVLCYQRGSSAVACRGVAGSAVGHLGLGEVVNIGGITALSLSVAGLGADGLGVVCFVNGESSRRVGCRALRLSTTLAIGAAAADLDALSEGEGSHLAVAALGGSAAVLCFVDVARGEGCRCRALTGEAGSLALAAGPGDLVAAAGLVRGVSLLALDVARALLCYQQSSRTGEQRGECRVVEHRPPEAWPLSTGAFSVVSFGRTWNLATARLSDDTALACYTDSSERERGKCRIVWGPWRWRTAEVRVCDANRRQIGAPSADCFA